MSENPLWLHQRQCIDMAKDRHYLALFMGLGTGKTRTQIEITRNLINLHKRLLRVVIFAPLSVCPQWKAQFLAYSKAKEEDLHVLTGPGKGRVDAISKITKGIIITNYEAVTIAPFFDALLKWSPEVLVCDELHFCKSPTSVRSKKIFQLAQHTPYRFGLTGTPILNTPMDLFSQYRILDLGANFGTNFYIFRKLYCIDKNAGMPKQRYFPKWVVKPEAEKFFAEVMAKTSFQAKKEDCIDLPPLVKVVHKVQMSLEQRRAYESMKREFVAEIGGVQTTAEFAMTKSLRMQQIICGFVQENEDGDAKWVKDNSRLDALEELLQTIGKEKCIIWTCFRPTYKKIAEVCTKVGLSFAFLTGLESAAEKQESLDKFKKDTQILISNPASGGTGISMEFSSYAIYYARSYNLSHFLQSESRNYRGGSNQHERVTHVHLAAENSLDEVIYDALSKKQKIGETILEWAVEKGLQSETK